MDNTLTSKTLMRKEVPKLTMHEKIENEEILARINRKIDFKKNPRYEGQRLPKFSDVNGKQTGINTAEVQQGPLRCDPPQIVFSNYQQDRVYEFEVSLVNISRVMKRIKLAPIKTPQFTVAQVRYPSGETGDIAPGMAAKVTVWFRPTMLREYGDELIVMSEDYVFKVPIIAKREQFNINLPKELNCGNCWVGDSLTSAYELINTGGSSKFSLSCGNGSVVDGILKIGQFQLQPATFSLDKGQKITLIGRYGPKEEGKRQETVQVNCDNGASLSFLMVGCGFAAEMALLSINGDRVDPAKKNHRVYFEALIPNQRKTSEVIIKNLATVDLKYRWKMPANSMLEVEHVQGVFKPMEEKTLKLSLVSKDTTPAFERFALELLDIPLESIRSREADGSQSLEYYCFEAVTCPVELAVAVSPSYYKFGQAIYRGATYTKKFTLTNPNNSDISYSISKFRNTKGVQSEVLSSHQSVIPKNSSIELQISFQMNTLEATPGKIEYMVSFTNAQSQFIQIEAEVRPAQITLQSERIDFGLLKTFSKGQQTLVLQNLCPVQVKVLIINQSKYYDNDFDDFYVYDEDNIACKHKRLAVEGQEEFTIPPSSQKRVTLNYNSRYCQTFSQKLWVEVEDGHRHQLEVFAEIQDIHVALSKSHYALNEIFVGNIYDIQKSEKSRRPLYLMNLSNIEAEYRWDIPKSESYEVTVTPTQGQLSPKSKVKVTVVVTPLQTTALHGMFRCHISSVSEPLQLEVAAEMRGLDVTYHLLDESLAKKVKVKDIPQDMNRTKSKKFTTITHTSGFASASIVSREKETTVYPLLERLEFFNCEINKPRQLEISIENLSDLNTEFEVEAFNYKTLQKEQKEVKQKSNLLGASAMAFTSQMGKTLIANRQLEQSQKQHLSNNKGLSILCEPRSGNLMKNSTVNIRVTLFNDICGRFSDRLVVRIKNHETKEFPVEIDIKGTPVCVSRNQVGINFNKEMPQYKLGVFPVRSGLIKKQFRVTNNGPKPVEVSWKIFSSETKADSDLFKLEIADPAPGSSDVVRLNWNPVEPEEQKDSPFVIEPRVKVLQGREESTFIVSFRTSEEPSSKKSILIGEPRLLISESEKAKMELLTIAVQADTIQPQLSIDPTFTNILTKFQKLAGQDSPKDTKTIMLENKTDASLIFSVELPDKCFELVASHCNSINSNALNDPKLLTSSKGFMRKTLQHTVQTSFNLVPRSHVELKLHLKGDCKNLQEWPMDSKLRRESKLVISYINGHRQQFELVGEYYRPVLQLNTTGFEGQNGEDLIQFGTVHVKNNKTMAIYLTNTSLAKAKWQLKYVKFSSKKPFEPVLWTKLDKEDQQITDEKDCFQFSCTQGTCQSLSVPIHLMPTTLALPAPDDEYARTHVPQKILVNFKPKKNVLYKSRFKILLEDGETLQFTVRGTGTYVQQRQK